MSIDIEAAAGRLRGVAHRTPVVTSTQLDERLGARIFLKAENLQRMGAFKFRGAYNRVSTLSTAERAAGVVTSSSGNHAQALALAARLCDARATILMPSDAPDSKRAATRGLRRDGGRLRPLHRRSRRADRGARRRAGRHGRPCLRRPVHHLRSRDGRPRARRGDGRAGRAAGLHRRGGLLAGCSLAVKSRYPATRVYGVEPEASDDWQRSLAAGRRVRVDVASTVADGQQLPTPGELNFAVARDLLAGIVTVTDDEVISAMRFLFERMKLVVEPSGASALAALLAGKLDVRGLRVGVTALGRQHRRGPLRFAGPLRAARQLSGSSERERSICSSPASRCSRADAARCSACCSAACARRAASSAASRSRSATARWVSASLASASADSSWRSPSAARARDSTRR